VCRVVRCLLVNFAFLFLIVTYISENLLLVGTLISSGRSPAFVLVLGTRYSSKRGSSEYLSARQVLYNVEYILLVRYTLDQER
jgi:hypothetical protein